jgi:cytochrome bd-type quinol oxidase subunit 2
MNFTMPYRSRQIRLGILLKVIGAGALYMLIVFGLGRFIESHPSSPWRWAAALAPFVGMLLCVIAAWGSVKGMDERDVRMHVDALAFAFVTSFFVLSVYTFLAYLGLPTIDPLNFMPVMVTLWAIGLGVSLWRYR